MNARDIRLRDRESKKEIDGTLEVEESRLTYQEVYYNPSASGTLEPDLVGPSESFGGMETKVDHNGERIFLTVDGDEVPESRVEPFVEGMSERRFGELRVTFRIIGPSNLDGVISKVEDAIRAGLPMQTYAVYETAPGAEIYRTISATELAMAMGAIDEDPSEFGLDKEGRDDLPTGGDGPSLEGMEINPHRDHWDRIPGHPYEDWKYEVENDDTRLGYEQWAQSRIDGARGNGDVICVHCGNGFAATLGCDSDFCEKRREEGSLEVCRSCGAEYTGGGDGYDGECPRCADRTAMVSDLLGEE